MGLERALSNQDATHWRMSNVSRSGLSGTDLVPGSQQGNEESVSVRAGALPNDLASYALMSSQVAKPKIPSVASRATS